jgi:hypothetical protein
VAWLLHSPAFSILPNPQTEIFMVLLSIVAGVWLLSAAIAIIEVKRAPVRDDFDRRDLLPFRTTAPAALASVPAASETGRGHVPGCRPQRRSARPSAATPAAGYSRRG